MNTLPLTPALLQTPIADHAGRVTLPWRRLFEQRLFPALEASATLTGLEGISEELGELEDFAHGILASLRHVEPQILVSMADAMARQEPQPVDSLGISPMQSGGLHGILSLDPVAIGTLGESLSSSPL